MINLMRYKSRDALASAVADYTLEALSSVLETSEKATWAVSGGSTPKPIFEKIREMEFQWSRVTIALVDERWVDPSHVRSNEKMVRTYLFQHQEKAHNLTKSAEFVGMKTHHNDPFTAMETVEARYKSLPPTGPLMLGMGMDGHTASFFPMARGLDDGLDPNSGRFVQAIEAVESPITGQETMRMTMTFAAIKASQHPHLIITGGDKLDVLQAAIEGGILPIARVAAGLNRPLDVFYAL